MIGMINIMEYKKCSKPPISNDWNVLDMSWICHGKQMIGIITPSPNGYPLVNVNSSPWKDPAFCS